MKRDVDITQKVLELAHIANKGVRIFSQDLGEYAFNQPLIERIQHILRLWRHHDEDAFDTLSLIETMVHEAVGE